MAPANQNKVNHLSTNNPNKDHDSHKKDQTSKDLLEKRDIIQKEIDKSSSFNLETEISKLKVSIPLTELVKNSHYKSNIVKMLKFDPMTDMVNVEDEQPELIFGPAIDGQLEDSEVPPFYLSLRIHQYILRNSMLDSRTFHNLMPRPSWKIWVQI